jgi:hypothetical protein
MADYFQHAHAVHYIPILTTLFSGFFFFSIFGRYRLKGSPHLLWWSIGVFTYGLGTALESLITLLGNSPELNKAWYVAGAILGGYPLAQGSVYLHFPVKKANIMTALTLPFIIFASIAVVLSPTDISQLEAFRPGGAAIGWQWVRLLTPFINLYAAIFLIGSAAYSAIRYRKMEDGARAAAGNWLIAIGALLPGIGGSFAKFGLVEALYIGEFIGIIMIYAGYRLCTRPAHSFLEHPVVT